MKARLVVFLLLFVAFSFGIGSIGARPSPQPRLASPKADQDGWGDHDKGPGPDACRNDDDDHGNVNSPIQVVGVIPIPGTPLASGDIIFTDSVTQRIFLADRTNFGVDVFDAENSVYVGRVPGFAGPNSLKPPNGQGPNGVATTNDLRAWAGDGNATLRVIDMDPTHTSPLTYLTIIQSIVTNNPECDDGTHHECNRDDEIAVDPADHMVFIITDSPTLASSPATPATPYGTFVDTRTYKIISQVMFPGAGGAEQPVWDPELRRFLISVPGQGSLDAQIAVIKPGASSVEKSYDLGTMTGIAGCTNSNGLAMGDNQHFIAAACGSSQATNRPVVFNGATGKLINIVTQIDANDEVWANRGDGRFYVEGVDIQSTATPQPGALGVIDMQSGQWLQTVDANGSAQPTADSENNHSFTDVRASTTTSAPTICDSFGYTHLACIAVFDHTDH